MVIERGGNLWDEYDRGHWIVVTTNGEVNKQGLAIMGRGIAKQAADKFPPIRKYLGNLLQLYGNHSFALNKYRILTLPTKHHWRERSDLLLIIRGINEMKQIIAELNIPTPVFLPPPGCGNGQLNWYEVGPAIRPYLDYDKFVIVNNDL